MGTLRVARSADTQLATNATTASTSDTPPNVSGSVVLTLKSVVASIFPSAKSAKVRKSEAIAKPLALLRYCASPAGERGFRHPHVRYDSG